MVFVYVLKKYMTPNQHASNINIELNHIMACLPESPLGTTGDDGNVLLCNKMSPNLGSPTMKHCVNKTGKAMKM